MAFICELWLSGKESALQRRRHGFNPWWRKSPGEGNDNPLLYSCLGNPWTEDPGGLWSMGTQKSRTWVSNNKKTNKIFQFSSVQSLSRVRLFATPWITARQSSLSITNSRGSARLTSIESVMPSSHLILCRPLLLLPPITPSIRVFSNESTLRMRWPKNCSFSFILIILPILC